MNFEEIYQPIADELKTVESFLASAIKESKNPSILAMSNFLLGSPGKRIRPALVILSEKAASAGTRSTCPAPARSTETSNRDLGPEDALIRIATAVELIHMASLIHDDVLDKASRRHNKPSVNARWSEDVSIALGDYIYSKAFQLIGKCKNPEIFSCISEAIYVMGEGELTQVCQRDNLDLSQDSCLTIVKKKTASLFAACCQAGTIVGNHNPPVQAALKEYGFNFGIAFQIIDDCKDLTSEEKILGKLPGQDIAAGDMTLPLSTLLDVISKAQKEELKNLLQSKINGRSLKRIRVMLVDSNALSKTQKVAASYINCAKERLEALADSDYKDSLSQLADCVIARNHY